MIPDNRYSSSPPAAEQPSPPNSTARIARLLVLAGILILLLWLGLKAWRVYQSTRSLLTIEPEVRALMAGGIKQIDPDAAEA
ncbi:MAG TPA: hypothetical protein PLR07_13665, partial [Promineifilum sp.]|nr:hypothetical protein [Promineifilum sp.]